MPFEITTSKKELFFRGEATIGYDYGRRTVEERRASVDLEEARGDIADIITDHRRAANALISDWRSFYRMTSQWDGEGMLTLTLPEEVTIAAAPVLEGTLRRRVQEARSKEPVVEQSLRWVVDTYNAIQKET